MQITDAEIQILGRLECFAKVENVYLGDFFL